MNVNVSGLPDGCNYSIITDPATGTIELTIFGSPTQLGVFDYLIETSGLLCDSEFSGTGITTITAFGGGGGWRDACGLGNPCTAGGFCPGEAIALCLEP